MIRIQTNCDMFYPVLCVSSALCSLNPNSARSVDYQSTKAMLSGHIFNILLEKFNTILYLI